MGRAVCDVDTLHGAASPRRRFPDGAGALGVLRSGGCGLSFGPPSVPNRGFPQSARRPIVRALGVRLGTRGRL